MGPEWLKLYPIFTSEFLDLMFGLLPEERHQDTILAVFLKGYKKVGVSAKAKQLSYQTAQHRT